MYTVAKNIFLKFKNIIIITIGSFFIFMILQILPVFRFMKSAYVLSDISTQRRWKIFYQYVFEPFSYVSLIQQILVISLAILTTCNILLFVLFVKKQKKVFVGKSFFASLSGMFLGLFGVGCISCGAFILVPLITFLGLGAYVNNFLEYAQLISGIGVVLVLVSIFYLLKQLSKPLVCT